MKILYKALSVMLCCLFFAKYAFSNGLQITGFAVDQNNQTATFTLSWNNSFRDSENWDAAWVFIKWRQCNVPNFTHWSHGLINTTLAEHTFPSIFEPTTSNGNAPGIDAAPNNTGVMIRRTSNGFGTVNGTITLKVSNMPTSGNYDFRIFGIEMVFIPEGSFYAGDQASDYCLRVSTSDNSPVLISSEGSISMSNFSSSSNYTIQPNFRKGFSAFYIMKYEITQGQYTDFLNTLGQSQADNRFPNSFASYRNRVQRDGTTLLFSCDRPDRAMNYLGWDDTWAYLDWAALRPLTELEYEKACRGPLAPIPFEFAWGTTSYTYGTTLSGTENGTETITTTGANVHAYNQSKSGGDGGTGPVRVGIFATSSTNTREASGASYYGVMNLSDNLSEDYFLYIAGTSGQQPGNNAITWGDGLLNTSGAFTNSEWNSTSSYIAVRGYISTGNIMYGRTSARGYSRASGGYGGRQYFTGGRGGR